MWSSRASSPQRGPTPTVAFAPTTGRPPPHNHHKLPPLVVEEVAVGLWQGKREGRVCQGNREGGDAVGEKGTGASLIRGRDMSLYTIRLNFSS